MDLNNRVAVVTGGASGIGAASARAFAARGARVVVTDVNGDGARAVADEIGGLGIACDVSSEADINALVAETESKLGPVEVFFSNAGIATGGEPITTPIDVWNEQWQVNVMAHVYAVRAVLPGMLDRGEGYLLHTASMAGILTTHGNATYAVTKHAVVGLVEWLAITYHDEGIRVSLLAPLGVNTPMLAGSELASGAGGPVKEPEEVANQVVTAIDDESFLILTDPIAQTWMDRKADDLPRWLSGMRRLQGKIDDMKAKRGD
jgi:NAD(P)-dependent dehydrogenase (short-subunit alcohol dehydrogenase family)